MRDAARTVASVFGIAWIAGFTHYPELAFMMAALCLHWDPLNRAARRSVREFQGQRARALLRRDAHADVGALAAFMGRR